MWRKCGSDRLYIGQHTCLQAEIFMPLVEGTTLAEYSTLVNVTTQPKECGHPLRLCNMPEWALGLSSLTTKSTRSGEATTCLILLFPWKSTTFTQTGTLLRDAVALPRQGALRCGRGLDPCFLLKTRRVSRSSMCYLAPHEYCNQDSRCVCASVHSTHTISCAWVQSWKAFLFYHLECLLQKFRFVVSAGALYRRPIWSVPGQLTPCATRNCTWLVEELWENCTKPWNVLILSQKRGIQWPPWRNADLTLAPLASGRICMCSADFGDWNAHLHFTLGLVWSFATLKSTQLNNKCGRLLHATWECAQWRRTPTLTQSRD